MSFIFSLAITLFTIELMLILTFLSYKPKILKTYNKNIKSDIKLKS
jgi:hypothetical protein